MKEWDMLWNEKEETNQNANTDECICIGKISSDSVLGCVEKRYSKSSDEDGDVQPGNPGFVNNEYDVNDEGWRTKPTSLVGEPDLGLDFDGSGYFFWDADLRRKVY